MMAWERSAAAAPATKALSPPPLEPTSTSTFEASGCSPMIFAIASFMPSRGFSATAVDAPSASEPNCCKHQPHRPNRVQASVAGSSQGRVSQTPVVHEAGSGCLVGQGGPGTAQDDDDAERQPERGSA